MKDAKVQFYPSTTLKTFPLSKSFPIIILLKS